jgi:hypothetical protein
MVCFHPLFGSGRAGDDGLRCPAQAPPRATGSIVAARHPCRHAVIRRVEIFDNLSAEIKVFDFNLLKIYIFF